LNSLRTPLGTALVAFQPLFPGFAEIVARSSVEIDPDAQAVIVANRFLNGNCVISFLPRVKKHDPWVFVHDYSSTWMGLDALLDTAMMLFALVMNSTEFMLAKRGDSIVRVQPVLAQRLIGCPALAHLETDDSRSSRDLVHFVANQLADGMRARKMQAGRFSPPFNFIVDAANDCGPQNEVFASFITVTRQIAEDSRFTAPHRTRYGSLEECGGESVRHG
jgi:hypothetical protein